MADSYGVVNAEVRDHAKEVTGLAAELRGAIDIAGNVRLTADAYGQDCQQIASMFNTVAKAAGQSIEAGIGALESAGQNLRGNSQTYADLEAGGAGAFTAIEEELT
jgi:uncharacterized protein YukE